MMSLPGKTKQHKKNLTATILNEIAFGEKKTHVFLYVISKLTAFVLFCSSSSYFQQN